MQNSTYEEDTSSVESFPVALIVGVFNRHVTQRLQDGVIAQLLKRGIKQNDIRVIEVPGVVEIPLIAKHLAMQKKIQSIIALGSVIRGETSHYDLVCDAVNHGCMQVSLQYDIPVIFGVLTTENEQQAWDRLGGKHGDKGIEFANAAITMHQLLQQL